MGSGNGLLRNHATSLSLIVRLLDLVACIVAGALAYLMRFGFDEITLQLGYPALVFIAALLILIVFPLAGLYQSWRTHPLLAPVARALMAWIIVFAIVLILLVLVKQSERFSREWLAMWFGLQATFLMLLRFGMYGGLRWLRYHGHNQRHIALVGNSPKAKELIYSVMGTLSSGFVISATFSPEEEVVDVEGSGLRPLRELKEYLATHAIDEVWVVLPLEQSQKLRTVRSLCTDSTANVRYVPDLQDIYLLNHGVTEILGTPMIDLQASPMQGPNRLLKALEDRMLAALILILVSPVMLVIAIGVKLGSKGPVFYRQERMGWNGRCFQMLKFRSMGSDAESKTGAMWANRDDDRANAFGKFIRRTSLDELPQFLNVLKGDMSIVGPRPERPMFVQQFKNTIPGYMQKHVVKAGITGWAQINGWRGRSDLNKRIDHDLYYIENWSLWFDLKIIFLTVFKGFVNKNAY